MASNLLAASKQVALCVRKRAGAVQGSTVFETADAPTEMEMRALKAARKASRRLAKGAPPSAAPKRNVRKGHGRAR